MLMPLNTFKKKEFSTKKLPTKFKEHILSKGGTEKPMVLYKRFRGKEPRPEALIKESGIVISCYSYDSFLGSIYSCILNSVKNDA